MEERSFYTRKVIGSNPIFLTKIVNLLIDSASSLLGVHRRWSEARSHSLGVGSAWLIWLTEGTCFAGLSGLPNYFF